MNVLPSHASRVFLVRLSKGESLVEALATVAREHRIGAATVVGHGVLQAATVEGYDPRARGYGEHRAFVGSLTLDALTGSVLQGPGDVIVHLHASLSRLTDNGIETLGGHVVDAQAVAVDVTVFAHDDVRMTLQVDGATGLHAWRGDVVRPPAEAPRAAPAPAPAPTPTPVSTPREPEVRPKPSPLAEAARALEMMPRREEPADPTAEVMPGDYVDHPAWRFCEVLREPEPGTLDIRLLDRGSTRTIKVEIFDVQPGPERDGHRVWVLRPRSRAT